MPCEIKIKHLHNCLITSKIAKNFKTKRQPELRLKIAELRKANGNTQEEISKLKYEFKNCFINRLWNSSYR